MKSELYLYEKLRSKYIDDLKHIKSFFDEKVYPIIATPDQEAEDYKKQLQNDLHDQVFNENVNEDLIYFIEESALKRFELLYLMRYLNICMWISCLCQTWEQQLLTFILSSANQYGIPYNVECMDLCFIKDVFKWHQQPITKLKCWKKIEELRLLVNVIKHAEGDSEKKLRVRRPDYFYRETTEREKVDLMKIFHTSLLEPTLSVSEKDFDDYYKALDAFWRELPERMTAEMRLPEKSDTITLKGTNSYTLIINGEKLTIAKGKKANPFTTVPLSSVERVDYIPACNNDLGEITLLTPFSIRFKKTQNDIARQVAERYKALNHD